MCSFVFDSEQESQFVSEKSSDDIGKLIDHIQSGLVELFDQLRELRRLLELSAEGTLDSSVDMAGTSETLSDSEKPAPDWSSAQKGDRPQPSGPESVGKPSTVVSADSTSSGEHATDMSATLSRLLDPIAYELRTDNASAEVIAEYVQAAKDRLITKERPNEKVAKDIDVVLRFLKARGKRSIKPEERDNILTRINRWKLHLSVSAP